MTKHSILSSFILVEKRNLYFVIFETLFQEGLPYFIGQYMLVKHMCKSSLI